MELLSIIVPVYNEEDTIFIFHEEVTKVLKTLPYDYEIIFVNDGSKDGTLEKALSLREKNPGKIKVIDFSRNFGKEGGLLAGLEKAKGDYVTVMDVDLQDPPSTLPLMFEEITKNGYDVVGTRRVTRKGEPPIRSWFARLFYKWINKFTEVEIVDGARDYRLMKREVVDAILQLKEKGRFSKGLFAWVGFKTKYLEYENIERVAGKTKWSFWTLLRYALDGIIEYTSAPLQISLILGSVLTGIMVCFLLVFLVMSLLGKAITSTTIVLTAILFFGGIILLSIGILGEYLSKTYDEVKARPNYIVKKFYD